MGDNFFVASPSPNADGRRSLNNVAESTCREDDIPSQSSSFFRTLIAEPQRMAQASFLCSSGWPLFWMMTFTGAFSEAMCLVVIPDVAYAQYNGGHDPCQFKSKHFDFPRCKAASAKFASALSFWSLVKCVLALLSSPLIAKLCDRMGRRPFIVIRAVLTQVHMCALVGIWYFDASVMWFFASVAILGLVPNSIVWNLWVADRVGLQERTRFFAVLTIVVDCQKLVLPVSVALASQEATVWLACISGFSCLLMSAFGIVESLPLEKRKQLRSDRETSVFDGIRFVRSNRAMKLLCLICLIGYTCASGITAIWFPWMKQRFTIPVNATASLLSVQASFDFVVNIFLVKPMTTCLGLRMLTAVAFATGIMDFFCYMFAPEMWYLYFTAPLASLSVVATPACEAIFINMAQPSQRAQIQAVFSQLMSVTKGLGPVFFGGVMSFALTTEPLESNKFISTNAPFILGVFMSCTACTIMFFLPPEAFPHSEEGNTPALEVEVQES